MVLGHQRKTPIYQKLKDTIVREIEGGTLKENDPILSERLLTQKFRISRISVRKAMGELIAENYLYTVPGKGTFVRGLAHELQIPAKRTFNLGYIFWGEQRSLIHIPYFAHIVAGLVANACRCRQRSSRARLTVFCLRALRATRFAR
jgi:DNA-binding transcriptional regulator YhcF (GntR family)